jgi:putative ABC transport system permease protein
VCGAVHAPIQVTDTADIDKLQHPFAIASFVCYSRLPSLCDGRRRTHALASATQSERFNLILVAGFAIAAILIAAIGIYGAIAYAATARWREFGVRLALGATPRALLRHVLWQAARLGLVGGAAGVAGALLVAVAIGDALYLVPGQHEGMLFEVTTTDPLSLVSALIGVVAVALIAGAVPAWRVTWIDPARVLRSE